MLYIEIILLAITLSIDAFSLAASISMSGFLKNKYGIYSVIVGLFHFFMPVLGYALKNIIDNIIVISDKSIIVAVILFILIGICVDKEKKITNRLLNPLIFAFSVSIDSFSVGLSLNSGTILISIITFSIISSLFTFFGFELGKIFNKNFEEKGKIISIIILLILLVYNLIH